MRFALRRVTNQIWYASVLGTTIYVFLFLIMVIWILHASDRNEYSNHILGRMYIGLSLHQILSIVNVTWLLFLVVDLFSALRLLTCPRKEKLSGIVLSIVAVATVQWAVWSLKRVADAYAI